LSGAVATPEVFTPYVEAVKAVTPPMAQ
jgi:hypothetical protein